MGIRHHLIGEAMDSQPIRGVEKPPELRPIPRPKGEESHRCVAVERRIKGQDIQTGQGEATSLGATRHDCSGDRSSGPDKALEIPARGPIRKADVPLSARESVTKGKRG